MKTSQAQFLQLTTMDANCLLSTGNRKGRRIAAMVARRKKPSQDLLLEADTCLLPKRKG